MNRRQFLSGSVAWLASRAEGAERPNILFLMTDQQTHSALSCARNRWLRTPAMDSLASSGLRFEVCCSPYPVCSPARSSIFTSRMPHETGVRQNGQAIVHGMPTMGEIFSAAGYETVYGGKWHLPKSFDGMTGFTRLIGGTGQGADMDEPLATECTRWLTSRKGSRPFLMVASFMNPHDICEWIRQHEGKRNPRPAAWWPPVPKNAAVDPAEPEWLRYHRNGGIDLMSQGVGIAAEWGAAEWREYLHAYYRLVEKVDAQIGRVLTALRRAGLDKSTLILLTSDHGEGMAGHRWVQKASFYEESVRVPLILAGARIVSRRRVDRRTLASHLDILPTFCDFAGIEPPATIRGRSLRAADRGTPLGRAFVASELRYGSMEREGRMLRSRKYKYIVFNGGEDPEQFFDLAKDPGETRNLVAMPGAQEALRRHRTELRRRIEATSDDFRPAAIGENELPGGGVP